MNADPALSSPDDFAATNPAEVAMTRRHLLRAAGLLTVGGLAGVLGVDQAQAATKKRTTATRKTGTSSVSSATAASSCTQIPEETGGPFPGDGSNGVNVLTLDGVLRRDIRSSFAGMSGTAKGVPLTMRFALRSIAKGCAPMNGAAFYVWHCDRDGAYSLYSPAVAEQNYLRGVQVADADGFVTFQTVFPGAYRGRWPHVHFEIYPSAAKATSSANALRTSQLAFPKATCETVYATAGYEASKQNFPQTPITSDMVFRDGWTTQTPVITGDATKGYLSTLTVDI